MEVSSVVGYHDVNNVKARELLQPHLSTDGFYLLRPSSDRKGGVLCTICVTKNNKLMNYRLVRDTSSGQYYIFQHTTFPNIQLLLAYYRTTPINVEVNTLLLHPVTLSEQRPQPEDGEDAYVVMERPPASKDDDGKIPGLHEYLPKSEINTVMNTYLGTDGWFLLRPSSTSEGQLTLAVSHSGRILNFKINGDGKQFYIAPKKRFNNVLALLDFYRTSPIKSKKYEKQKIFLLHPIPVDKSQENAFKQKIEQKVAKKMSSTNLLQALPEPWQEHYDERHKRCYYYNPQTQQSSWDRPQAPPPTQSTIPSPTPQIGGKSPKLPSRSDTIQGRPLPATPGGSGDSSGSSSVTRRMSDVTGSMSPRQKRAQQPLPTLPDKEDASPKLPQRRNTEFKRTDLKSGPQTREVPPLPSKETHPPSVPGRVGGGGRGSLPALPPKEDGMALSPSHKGPSSSHVGRSPNFSRRGPVPVPGGEPSPARKSGRGAIPSLPPKEPEKALPQLPQRQTNGSISIPPLPPKESSPPPVLVAPDADKPLPPLPPKPRSPSPPAKTMPPASNIRSRKKIVEYEDFPIRQPPKSKSNIPPLPAKEPAGSSAGALPPPPPPLPVVNGPPAPVMNGSGGAPPPPPPPPVGVPTPPPPPPNAPPSPNPAAFAAKKPPPPDRNMSTSSDEGGRPFTANDLAAAKTLLKKRKEVPEQDRRNTSSSTNSGIAGVFANAIDSRMMSIRKAMVDSDSGESEFEDVDDDDWD